MSDEGAAEGSAANERRFDTALSVYTSFDGDFIRRVPRMCLGACLLGYAPLNPEAALGYKLSTEAFGDTKIGVMRACVAVELCADEFWIITARPGLDGLREVSEGVLAEYLLWKRERPKAAVRQFPWLSNPDWLEFLNRREASEVELAAAVVDDDGHDALASLADEEVNRNLDERFFSVLDDKGLPRVAFVSTAPEDDKHVDWAREFLYESDLVALVPDLLVGSWALEALIDSPFQAEVRMSYASRADEMWAFTQKPATDLPDRIRSDLELARLTEIPTQLRRWSEVGVPKYTDPDWAMTDRERDQEPQPGS